MTAANGDDLSKGGSRLTNLPKMGTSWSRLSSGMHGGGGWRCGDVSPLMLSMTKVTRTARLGSNADSSSSSDLAGGLGSSEQCLESRAGSSWCVGSVDAGG